MLIHDCIPCQHGNHDSHRRVVQTVPEGMMGGQECHCEGECVERERERRERIAQTKPLLDRTDYTALAKQMDELFGKSSR